MALARQDFAFPFRIDPASQQTAQAAYPAHVDQMVRQLLLTAPGERVNLPQFGCGLRALVFGPNTAALAAAVQLRVIQGISEWLADQVTGVNVTVASGSAAGGQVTEPGAFQVTVTYTLVETLTTETVTVAVA